MQQKVWLFVSFLVYETRVSTIFHKKNDFTIVVRSILIHFWVVFSLKFNRSTKSNFENKLRDQLGGYGMDCVNSWIKWKTIDSTVIEKCKAVRTFVNTVLANVNQFTPSV